MIGKQIGDWTVIAEEPRKKNFRFWRCRCKCGFERMFTTSYLNTGQAKCCDTCKEKNKGNEDEELVKKYLGHTYGSYTIIKYLGKNKYASREWLCRCKCGEQRVFLTAYLFGNGERRATVCMKCYKEEEELKHRVNDDIPDRFWKKLLNQAKRRGIEVGFPKDEALALYLKQGKKCCFSGKDLYFTKLRSNFNRYTTASLDRISFELGYEIGNVQWVHKKVNMMKHQLSDEDFIQWCKLIAEHKKG